MEHHNTTHYNKNGYKILALMQFDTMNVVNKLEEENKYLKQNINDMVKKNKNLNGQFNYLNEEFIKLKNQFHQM